MSFGALSANAITALNIGVKWAQCYHNCGEGVVPEKHGIHLANYFEAFNKETLGLTHAAGYVHPSQFFLNDIERSTGVDSFSTLDKIHGYVPVRPVIDAPWDDLDFPE